MNIERMSETLAGNPVQGYFASCCETSLKVRVGNNGPWTPKSSHCYRRRWPDSVRRSRLDRAVFPAHWFARGVVAARSLCSAQQSLQYQRICGSVALSAHLGSWTNRDNRTVAPQRSFSLPGGFARISRCHEFATLLAEVGWHGTQFLAETARPLADSHAGSIVASYFRSGQYGADRLWPSATSRGGLQPQKAARRSRAAAPRRP